MTDFRKEIELIIQAQLKGGKDIDSVVKGINQLEKAIEQQTDAAKKGESSIDELKASLEALKQVQVELAGKASLIGSFQKLGQQIGKTEDRITKTAKAYQDYKTKLDAVEKVTDKQQDRLIRLAIANERATQSLAKQRDAQQAIAESLREAGIATDNLAASEAKVRTIAADLGVQINKAGQAIKDYAVNVRGAKEAEAALAAENAFQKKLQDAQNLAKSSQYVSFWTNALDKAEASQKQLGVDNSLRKAADEADNAARKYTTLARAADTLIPKQTSLRDAINDILNPAAKARSTIQSVEQEVVQLSATIGKIKGPVGDYKDTLDRLAQSQKTLAQQASLVDTFSRQAAALRQARTEFTQARAEVAQYAAAVRQGGDAGAAFTGQLAQAQSRLKAASQSLNEQITATRQSRDALRQAGINTADLSGAQQRLISTTQQAVNATNNLTAAKNRYGESAAKARREQGLFADEGRTTLSFLQRLRGQLLSVAAAYVGLFGAINTVRQVADAANTRDAARNQLAISVGNDRKLIDAEYEYVKGQADRIKVQFDRAIKSYAKFSAAATLAGRKREEIRFIFETFLEVSRVAGLSADDLDGVFRALEQITSKGKIQAEELRGQLGDRLFGAFQVAAKALKDQFPDLDKALEKGVVTSDQLVRIAAEYRKIVADQLPGATKTLAAQQADLNNALFDFKLAIGDSGFIDRFTETVVKISEFLRSEDGAKAANSIGKAFTYVAEAVIWVFKNLELVKGVLLGFGVVMSAIVSSKAIKALWGLGEDAITLAGKIKTLAGTVGEFAAKWPLLATAIKGAFGAVGAFIVGWQIGKWARDKFAEVRQAGTWMATGLVQVATIIQRSFEVAFDVIPGMAENMWKRVLNHQTEGMRKFLALAAKVATASGQDELAVSINKVISTLTLQYNDTDKKIADARENLKKELAQIKAIRDDMLKDDKNDPILNSQAGAGRGVVNPANAKATRGAPTPFPGFTKPKPGGDLSEAEIKRKDSLIEQITRSIETLEARIDRAQTETLAKQLEAIDTQYASLFRKIGELKKVAPAAANELLARLTTSTNDLRKQTTDKFNADLMKDRSTFINKVEDLEASAGKRQTLDLEARQNAIRLQYADLYRELNELRLKFFNNDRDSSELDAARARIDMAVEERVELEAKKFAQEELTRREERLNQIIATRDTLIKSVNEQVEAGTMTEVAGMEQIDILRKAAIVDIQAAAQAMIVWAEAHKEVFQRPEDFDLFIAKLQGVVAMQTQLKTGFTVYQNAVKQGVLGVINNSLNGVVDNLQKVATGQQTIAQGFKGMLSGFLEFAAGFLREIAMMIIKLQLFNALKAMGGFFGEIGSLGLASMGVKHDGGVIGSYGSGQRTRNVSPAWFANAPRYHSGGMPGLRQDEYATILQRGEEVLAADSPRNIMNGGAGLGGGGGAAPAGQRFVLVDERSRIPEAMASAEGEQVTLVNIRKNAASIRQILGMK